MFFPFGSFGRFLIAPFAVQTIHCVLLPLFFTSVPLVTVPPFGFTIADMAREACCFSMPSGLGSYSAAASNSKLL